MEGPRPNTVVHYWIYKDDVVAREKVNVNASTMTAWSKASMSPEKKGAWRVDIRLESGKLLGSVAFTLR